MAIGVSRRSIAYVMTNFIGFAITSILMGIASIALFSTKYPTEGGITIALAVTSSIFAVLTRRYHLILQKSKSLVVV